MRLAGVADGAPGSVDAGVQRIVRNNPSVPDILDQLFLADDVASVLNQIDE